MVEPQALKKTWSELEAEGVKRCCVILLNGKRCRRRASEAFRSSWCDKHGPTMQMYTDWANTIIRRESN